MKTSLVLLCLLALSLPLILGPKKALAQGVSDFFQTSVGSLKVIALADSSGVMDFGLLNDIDQDSLDKAKSTAQLEPGAKGFKSYVNAYVVETKSGLVLIDTGNGPGHGLSESLKKAQIKPDDIAFVFITHFHNDHIGGLADDAGKPFFKNAVVYAAKEEDAYWLANVGDSVRSKSAQAILAPYKQSGRYKTFEPGETLIEGVTIVPLYGHTPGHTGFLFEDKGQNLLVWGDIVHVRFVQFDRPKVSLKYDTDPKEAVTTRLKLFEELAGNGSVVAGVHLPFPGIGTLSKAQGPDEGFVYQPVK
jgi:glyoxylase-like metal-dependent hydrolase (beta-lactamase superfamily II)